MEKRKPEHWIPVPELRRQGNIGEWMDLGQFDPKLEGCFKFEVFSGDAVAASTTLHVDEQGNFITLLSFDVKEQFQGRGQAKNLYQQAICSVLGKYQDIDQVETTATGNIAMVKVRHGVELPEGWDSYYGLHPTDEKLDYFEKKTLGLAAGQSRNDAIIPEDDDLLGPLNTKDIVLVLECIKYKGKATLVIVKD